MTTCMQCEYNHVMNVFHTGKTDEDGLDVLECPQCGSRDCVRDAVARERLDDPDNDDTFEKGLAAIVPSNDDQVQVTLDGYNTDSGPVVEALDRTGTRTKSVVGDRCRIELYRNGQTLELSGDGTPGLTFDCEVDDETLVVRAVVNDEEGSLDDSTVEKVVVDNLDQQHLFDGTVTKQQLPSCFKVRLTTDRIEVDDEWA